MLRQLPPVTRSLLLSNVIIFVFQQPWLLGDGLLRLFALWPIQSAQERLAWLPDFHVWQLISYGFLHASLGHVFFNLFSLWMFGCALELTWGPRRFLGYYLICIVGAGVCQLITMHLSDKGFPALGASGGVFGIMLGYGMIFPRQPVFLLFPPIRLQAKTFVGLCALIELVLGVADQRSGIAHFAHLGGALTGWLLIRYWRDQKPMGPTGPNRPSRLRF